MADFSSALPDGNDWVNQKFRELEARIRELQSARSGESTTIGSGGVTIRDDGYLQMVDDNNTQILFFGPDANGKQLALIRRESGAYILRTGTVANGNNFWALTDGSNRTVVSDDAVAGKGLARPWLPVFLTPTFVPNLPTAGTTGTWCIDSTQVVTEVGLWEGRASISHPWIMVDGSWGHASGSGTVTYRLKVAGVQVGTWDQATQIVAQRGPYDVSAHVGKDFQPVQITAQQTTGTGAVRCHPLGCYLTQTI